MDPKQAIEYGMIDKVRAWWGRPWAPAGREQAGHAGWLCRGMHGRCLPAAPPWYAPASRDQDNWHPPPAPQILTTPMPKMPPLGPAFRFERSAAEGGGPAADLLSGS